jgi:hypothetical protein
MPLDWRKRGGKQAGGQLVNLATVVYPVSAYRAVMCGTDDCADSAGGVSRPSKAATPCSPGHGRGAEDTLPFQARH